MPRTGDRSGRPAGKGERPHGAARAALSPVLVAGLALCSGVVAGCGGDHGRSERRDVAMGAAQLGGEVVSTVAGSPITRGDVDAMVQATGLTAHEVLRRLQDRALLMREAEARGLDGGEAGAVAAKKAAVQALLAEEVESKALSDTDLREAYDAATDKYVKPERRTSEHVVVLVEPKAPAELRKRAKAVAERAREFMRREPDFRAVQREVATWGDDELRLKAEVLPAVPKGGRSFVPAFTAPLFAAPGLGLMPEIVETRFGFHAVRITAIEPPETISFEAARAELEAEVGDKLHKQRLEALLKRLYRATRIQRDTDAIAKLGNLTL